MSDESDELDAVQIVLYFDPDALQTGWGDIGKIEHHIEGLTVAQVEMADEMGIGRFLLFPAESGTAGATVLARLIEDVLNKHRLDPRDKPRVELARRLRSIARACYQFPRDSVMARLVKRP